jgi:hypothetical protein
VNFKDKQIEERFNDLHPMAQKIAMEMDEFVFTNFGIHITITATVSTSKEDALLLRKSDTHRTRRAWDVRVIDLPESVIAKLCSEFRKKYGKLGAVSSNMPQLIVYKPHGTGPHLHCQLNRKYALKELTYGN